MLTETYPARQRTAGPVLWALTSGIAGLVANVLLVLFFLLARPFGVSGPLAEAGQDFMWLGSANDCGDHRAVPDVHSGGAGLAQVAAAHAIGADSDGCGCRRR